MKRLTIIPVILALSACGMTAEQKKWAGFAVGVLAVGAIAAHELDSGKPTTAAAGHVHTPGVACAPQCAQ